MIGDGETQPGWQGYPQRPLPSDNHDRLNISWNVEETESAVLAETAPSLRTRRRLSTARS